ncbi:hypothetical protein UK15_15555 [Streptomyces variegatus]|jgi:uncharacterized protein (DUF2252 family)|uniref:DUF2252 domain-containing protein n=1 Tax=Streptomyces variegatus TaxID=284040 RepID=A0A0M2GTT4_9ACTN|nr:MULTISPECIES: DUF2252 domain-containing protein [Streptomyces]KJK38877.1 hypothetical protein UK15_15555 [Streptomyces variegatus]
MTVSSPFTAFVSPAERAAAGRDARRRVPRSSQAGFEAGPDRFDPVEVVDRQSATRVPELVPIRYGRMLESPFRFYRGAAAIMAADLGATADTGLRVQLCGDAHLLNFRLLASPERHLVFDINDFDETLAGPFEWDVKRLAASFAVAGRANGFSAAEQTSAVQTCVRAYRRRMREFAGMRTLDIWYAQDDADRLRELMAASMSKEARRRTAKATADARTRTHVQAYAKLTRATAEGRRITPDPPLITPLRDLADDSSPHGRDKELHAVLEGYARTLSSERRHLLRRYRPVDIARKVVGVGSVGTRCWIVLLLGRDDDDPLLLQAKEAQESVLAAHCGGDRWDNQGRRVVAGQRLIQTTSDILLGWTHAVGLDGHERDFYVRQLRDWKGIARPETMDPGLLRLFGRLCGASLARAHARSGDPVALAAYLGGGDRFDRALAVFAQAYADQNERDFEALGAAVRSGRVRAAAQ